MSAAYRDVRDVLQFHPYHKTLRTTPAMAAGVTSRLWEIGDIVDVLEPWEAVQVDHGEAV